MLPPEYSLEKRSDYRSAGSPASSPLAYALRERLPNEINAGNRYAASNIHGVEVGRAAGHWLSFLKEANSAGRSGKAPNHD